MIGLHSKTMDEYQQPHSLLLVSSCFFHESNYDSPMTKSMTNLVSRSRHKLEQLSEMPEVRLLVVAVNKFEPHMHSSQLACHSG